MSLDSIEYLGFLALLVPVFWLITSPTLRWVLLLAASVTFHVSFSASFSLVIFTILLLSNFALAKWIHRENSERLRRRLFWSGIAVNVAVLAFSQYSRTSRIAFGLTEGSVGEVPATVGVSYCVLTTISYLADVYARATVPEPHLGYFALHLWFFPKLVQGPIERPDLMEKFRSVPRFDYDQWRAALVMIGGGLFKKLVVANRLGLYVDLVYGDLRTYTGVDMILATYMYALQVYFDFSGYTDIALGSAALFGVPLTPNFNSPYLAHSVAEFWRRWHMSFSRWLLDYIFRPLQMKWRDLRNAGTAAALLVTFLISGLWHGIGWSFVIWGALHGLYLAASIYYRPVQAKMHARLGIRSAAWLPIWQAAVTFNLVSLAWIFFRARSVSDAWYVVTHLLVGLSAGSSLLRYRPTQLGIVIVAGLTLAAVTWMRTWVKPIDYLFAQPSTLRWAVYYAIIVAILLFGERPHVPFIYARF